MFKEIYEQHNFKVYLLNTKRNCYQIMLKNDVDVVAIYYVSKDDGFVFGFYPVEYTYASTNYYNDIIQSAIKVLLSEGGNGNENESNANVR